MSKLYKLKIGKGTFIFYTEYHREQFARALRLNETIFIMVNDEH